MKIYDVCGIGNGIMDILIRVSDEEFSELGLARGGASLVDIEKQQKLLKRFADHSPTLASGGSVANSIFAISQLGGKGALATSLGDDRYGLFFDQECEAHGIELGNALTVGQPTGTCLILITPDSERTMCTCLGVSSQLSDQHVTDELLSQSKWIFIEGYLFANEQNGRRAIAKAVSSAKESGCRVALTLSDDWIVGLCPEFLAEVTAAADLVFANEKEALALTGMSTLSEAISVARSKYKNFVFTAGAKGAYVNFEKTSEHIAAFPCEPVDLTGAGDIFAGSFLYGVSNNMNPATAAKCGCYLASKVISRIGARLHSGTRQYWDEVAP